MQRLQLQDRRSSQMDKTSGIQIKEEPLDSEDNWDAETIRFITYIQPKLYIRTRRVQYLFKTISKRKVKQIKGL